MGKDGYIPTADWGHEGGCSRLEATDWYLQVPQASASAEGCNIWRHLGVACSTGVPWQASSLWVGGQRLDLDPSTAASLSLPLLSRVPSCSQPVSPGLTDATLSAAGLNMTCCFQFFKCVRSDGLALKRSRLDPASHQYTDCRSYVSAGSLPPLWSMSSFGGHCPVHERPWLCHLSIKLNNENKPSYSSWRERVDESGEALEAEGDSWFE